MRKNVSRRGKPLKFKLVGDSQEPDRTYYRELHKIVDRVFEEASSNFDWTWGQLAVEAGLGYNTVANLGDRKTKWPRFSTIWRLCKAVGFDLDIQSQPKNQRKALKLCKIAS